MSCVFQHHGQRQHLPADTEVKSYKTTLESSDIDDVSFHHIALLRDADDEVMFIFLLMMLIVKRNEV